LRLKTLHLERYGHFTDKLLEFREGACLHVVHGANEAGKSCSLAAITDLFFKFENKSEWDFLHPGKLSVGATIVGSDGETLSFKRRKGTKYTMLDDAGGALPEDTLDRYLGSLTRETFSRAFGLSAKRLRRGAKEMLKSGGEVGASLFAAASGLRGLNELRSRLAAEAGSIFMPTKSQNRTFYQALKRFEDAAKEIKEREFKERELKERTGRIDKLQADLDAVRELRRNDMVRREELERLCEVAPLLGAIAAKEQALRAWDGVPPVSAGELVRLRKGLQAMLHADSAFAGLVAEYEDARRHAESFEINRALLGEDAAIQSLQSQTGAFTEKKGQIGGVRAEGDHLRRELEGMRTRLGLSVEADLTSLQPSDATGTRTRRLLGEGRRVQQDMRVNGAEREKERSELDRLASQRSSAGAVEDPAPVRAQLQRLMPVLSRLEPMGRTKRKLELDQAKLAEQSRDLAPPVADVERLALVGVPERGSVQRFASEWEDISQRVGPLERRVCEAVAAIEEGEARRAQFEARSPVASPERIAEERRVCQAGWEAVRRVLLDEDPAPAPGALVGMLTGFEGAMASDRLADQAIADADRLAEYLANERQIAAITVERQVLQEQLQGARDTESDLQRRWLALWEPVVAEPQAPPAMLLWLAEAVRLLERWRDLLVDAQEVREFEAEVVQVRPSLDETLGRLGIGDAEKLSVKLALAAAEAELEAREQLWKSAAELLVRERDLTDRLRRLDEMGKRLDGELAAWKVEWRSMLPDLHLTADSDCDEVDAVLTLWQSVPDKTEALALSARRVTGMQRDMKMFEEKTMALLGRLGETAASVDADAVIKLLAEKLGRTRTQQSKHDEAERVLAVLRGRKQDAEQAAEARRAEFVTLSASLPETEDPEVLLDSLEQRKATLRELTEKRETLASLARNRSEAELREALAVLDEAQARVTVSELRRKDEQYNTEENTAFADLKNAHRELEALQSGTGAELALQLKRNAEAELLQQTHDWAVKRIGQILLTQAVENHRSRQEQPLLRRASELFGLLTAGSFVSIEQEQDRDSDEQKVSLVGRRDAERTCCMSAMSTGTRDQLYLALRLAYLEQYAASTESVPFIGDDLFTSSDECRTVQGLKALAATGHLIQPILFTHHEHVVELARRELGDGVDVIVLER